MFITLSLVAVLIAPIASFSYPVFGTKRYHRAINANKGIMPVYSAPYYDEPILAPTFPRYPSDTSNYYYVPRRESQYYGLPTYRGEYKPTQYYYAHSPSYYDDRSDQANPLDDLHEEMLHEDQRDRLRDYSIGQETWYENPAAARQDKLTNVFLKNLIAYNKEQLNEEPELDDGQNGEFDEYSDGNDAEYYDQPSNNNLNIRKYSNHQQQHQNSFKENEDKDVMDLNSLAANSYNKEPISQSNYPDYQQDFSNTYEEEDPEYDDDTWINWSSKRSGGNADQPIKPIGLATFSDRKPSTEQHLHKPIVSVPTTKQAPSKPSSAETTTTAQHNDNAKGSKTGQKEIVLPRPATPVRTPFSEPLMEMLTHNAIHDKRQVPGNSKTKSPSTVYDTIRQLLAMEQNLDKTATETKVQKRFVSNEESLVHQLNGLRESKKV
ncbi:uncharacterized protein LOC119066438 [Bradysia coprophila]|uniref:uncharacterized protein LOC119066438 n=1 Tax=Bradysia coprophila TaxID=38358 RepID=UPI00187D9306|nr:uncharacterized protein LOC119066438 [Bradysia coprophila]